MGAAANQVLGGAEEVQSEEGGLGARIAGATQDAAIEETKN